MPLGLVAGYFGGHVDGGIMRCLDVVMAFPTILLAIGIVTVLGQSLMNLMVDEVARVVRLAVHVGCVSSFDQHAAVADGGAPEQDASGPRGADAESPDGRPIVPARPASVLRRTHHTDGASAVLDAAFPEAGHARLALGASSLPAGVPVELDVILQLR